MSREIWEQVKENHRKLRECPGPHDFHKIDEGKVFGPRYRCSVCQGEVCSTDYAWYRDGLEHGRKERNVKSR